MIDSVIPSGQGLAASFDLAGAVGETGPAPSLTLKESEYLPMLADYDLTDNQASELLATLWQIMCACVELGLDMDVCGELGASAVPVLSNDAGSIESKDHPS